MLLLFNFDQPTKELSPESQRDPVAVRALSAIKGFMKDKDELLATQKKLIEQEVSKSSQSHHEACHEEWIKALTTLLFVALSFFVGVSSRESLFRRCCNSSR